MKRSIHFLVIVLMFFSIISSTFIYISASNSFKEIIDVSNTNDLQNFNYLCSSSFSWEAMSSQFSRSLPYNLVGAKGEIHTTDGTEIQNVFICSSDYTQSQAEIARDAYMDNHYPNITEAYTDSGLATASYNCHAFAWYGSPYNGSYWIDYPTEFIDDIHCREITDLTELQEDDIIVFWDGELAIHSAKIYNIYFEAMSNTPTIECISKCGPQGVYIHSFEYTMQMYPYTSCSYYRYEQDQHDLKLKQDNGEDGCLIGCSIEACPYTMCCDELVDYEANGAEGHYASCQDGCFISLENHNYSLDNVYDLFHTLRCQDCYYTLTESHTFYVHQNNGDNGCIVKCHSCTYTLESTDTPYYISDGNSGHIVFGISDCGAFTEDHTFYMYSDNGEDGCIVKCQYCDYTIYCDEAPEYLDIGAYGHYTNCPGGCFAFVADHTFDYSPQSATYHIGICIYCMYYVPEIPHTWVETATGYICSDCGISITYNLANGISNLSDEELSVLLTLLSESERNALISSLSSDTDISRITIAIDVVNNKKTND